MRFIETFLIVINLPAFLHAVNLSKAFWRAFLRVPVRTPSRSQIIYISPTVKWVYPWSFAARFLSVSCFIRFCRDFKRSFLFWSSPNEADASENCIDRNEGIKYVLDGMNNRYISPASGPFSDVDSKCVGKRTSSSEMLRTYGGTLISFLGPSWPN